MWTLKHSCIILTLIPLCVWQVTAFVSWVFTNVYRSLTELFEIKFINIPFSAFLIADKWPSKKSYWKLSGLELGRAEHETNWYLYLGFSFILSFSFSFDSSSPWGTTEMLPYVEDRVEMQFSRKQQVRGKHGVQWFQDSTLGRGLLGSQGCCDSSETLGQVTQPQAPYWKRNVRTTPGDCSNHYTNANMKRPLLWCEDQTRDLLKFHYEEMGCEGVRIESIFFLMLSLRLPQQSKTHFIFKNN